MCLKQGCLHHMIVFGRRPPARERQADDWYCMHAGDRVGIENNVSSGRLPEAILCWRQPPFQKVVSSTASLRGGVRCRRAAGGRLVLYAGQRPGGYRKQCEDNICHVSEQFFEKKVLQTERSRTPLPLPVLAPVARATLNSRTMRLLLLYRYFFHFSLRCHYARRALPACPPHRSFPQPVAPFLRHLPLRSPYQTVADLAS